MCRLGTSKAIWLSFTLTHRTNGCTVLSAIQTSFLVLAPEFADVAPVMSKLCR